MANFTPQKIDLSQIHGGQRYENGQTLDANAINAALEGAAYANSKGAVLSKMYQLNQYNPTYIEDMKRYYIPNSKLPNDVKECLGTAKALFWYYYSVGVPQSCGQDIGTVDYKSYPPTENDVFFWNGDLFIPKVGNIAAIDVIQIHLLFIL